jgi:hypothetical protein
MNFSFIIFTNNPNIERIETCISTIKDLNIPNYEIIVVGGKHINKDIANVIFVDFDEEQQPGWITRKKNIGVSIAKYENLCILHDYFAFDSNWYTNWISFGNNWDVATNTIKGINGERIFTDWVTLDDPIYGKGHPLPYSDSSRTSTQYISGGFFLVKKQLMIDYPLNERLVWNDEEDVEWSLRIRNKFNIVCNDSSIVRHTKWHRELNGWRKIQKRFIKEFGISEWKN